jgi:hypothetical protein
MIMRRLRVGMRVMLPSGNVVVLVRRHGIDWVCEYHSLARLRGEVEFRGAWLRVYGYEV